MESNPRVKQEVVDINSDDDQPAKSDVKEDEEPSSVLTLPPCPPSQEHLDLQQKVIKLEKDYKGACRLAREAQLRVEFLENIIDKKPALVESVEKKADDLQKKLAEGETSTNLEAAARENQMMAREAEMTQEIVSLKSEIGTLKYENAGLRRTVDSVNIVRELEADPEKKFRVKFDALVRVQNEKMRRVEEERARDRARIGELIRKLAKYEGGQDQPPMTPSLIVTVLTGTCSYAYAAQTLRSKYFWDDAKWREKYRSKVYNDNFECHMCRKKKQKGAFVLAHFFSAKHAKSISANSAAVSLAAFKYWMGKLESIPKTAVSAPVATSTPTSAKAAAAPFNPTMPPPAVAKPTVPTAVTVPAPAPAPHDGASSNGVVEANEVPMEMPLFSNVKEEDEEQWVIKEEEVDE